jgi:hypothetical protein
MPPTLHTQIPTPLPSGAARTGTRMSSVGGNGQLRLGDAI